MGIFTNYKTKQSVDMGVLYEVAYPLEGSEERLRVATTRPETLWGDVALAVHPEDRRYQVCDPNALAYSRNTMGGL